MTNESPDFFCTAFLSGRNGHYEMFVFWSMPMLLLEHNVVTACYC